MLKGELVVRVQSVKFFIITLASLLIFHCSKDEKKESENSPEEKQAAYDKGESQGQVEVLELDKSFKLQGASDIGFGTTISGQTNIIVHYDNGEFGSVSLQEIGFHQFSSCNEVEGVGEFGFILQCLLYEKDAKISKNSYIHQGEDIGNLLISRDGKFSVLTEFNKNVPSYSIEKWHFDGKDRLYFVGEDLRLTYYDLKKSELFAVTDDLKTVEAFAIMGNGRIVLNGGPFWKNTASRKSYLYYLNDDLSMEKVFDEEITQSASLQPGFASNQALLNGVKLLIDEGNSIDTKTLPFSMSPNKDSSIQQYSKKNANGDMHYYFGEFSEESIGFPNKYLGGASYFDGANVVALTMRGSDLAVTLTNRINHPFKKISNRFGSDYGFDNHLIVYSDGDIGVVGNGEVKIYKNKAELDEELTHRQVRRLGDAIYSCTYEKCYELTLSENTRSFTAIESDLPILSNVIPQAMQYFDQATGDWYFLMRGTTNQFKKYSNNFSDFETIQGEEDLSFENCNQSSYYRTTFVYEGKPAMLAKLYFNELSDGCPDKDIYIVKYASWSDLSWENSSKLSVGFDSSSLGFKVGTEIGFTTENQIVLDYQLVIDPDNGSILWSEEKGVSKMDVPNLKFLDLESGKVVRSINQLSVSKFLIHLEENNNESYEVYDYNTGSMAKLGYLDNHAKFMSVDLAGRKLIGFFDNDTSKEKVGLWVNESNDIEQVNYDKNLNYKLLIPVE